MTTTAGVAEPYYSFPTWFFDYDNDGWLDLFVAGYRIQNVGDIAADYLGMPHEAERARLYHNNRDGTFADVTKESGLYKVLHAMGSNYGDLDNDGLLDIYLGTGDPDLATIVPNRMFLTRVGSAFSMSPLQETLDTCKKATACHSRIWTTTAIRTSTTSLGGAYGGDVYMNCLFENPGSTNHWITLELVGKEANRAAIGARIEVKVDADEKQKSIFRTVGSGGSFGASPLRQEIGLGAAGGPVAVSIQWPGAKEEQHFSDLEMKTFYQLTQGEAKPRKVDLKTFRFQSSQHSASHSQHAN